MKTWIDKNGVQQFRCSKCRRHWDNHWFVTNCECNGLWDIVETVDRYVIVFFGRPSYVGQDIWIKTVLDPIRSRLPEKKCPIEIVCLMWDHDVWGTGNNQSRYTGIDLTRISDFGLLNRKWSSMVRTVADDSTVTGLIPACRTKWEAFAAAVFNFADSVTTVWLSYYDVINRVANEVDLLSPNFKRYRKGTVAEDNISWRVQIYMLHEFYRLHPEIADRWKDTNTVIIKTRYDTKFIGYVELTDEAAMLDRMMSLEGMALALLGPSMRNQTNNKILNVQKDIENTPRVVLEKGLTHHVDGLNNFVIFNGGSVEASDVIAVYNACGFIFACQNFPNWMYNDVENRFLSSDSAEIIQSKFYVDNEYVVSFSSMSKGVIGKFKEAPIVYEIEEDMSRLEWYNYTPAMTELLYQGQ
tara:strand:+ start:222 stop:1457 length:1236 start_codon:yes stop_codon:yes gene_type:complete